MTRPLEQRSSMYNHNGYLLDLRTDDQEDKHHNDALISMQYHYLSTLYYKKTPVVKRLLIK